jgi:type VI secretion system secreted protein Hcp
MAYDAFIKIDGIAGDSTDKQHPGEISVDSFSFGETNATSRTASGAGAGRVSFQDLHITARVSKASPLLMLFCASGKHIPTATLTARSTSGEEATPFDFLFVKMNDVLVTSYQDGFGGGERPVDSVSFAFGKISFQYREEKVNGSLGDSINFAWDLKAMRKI